MRSPHRLDTELRAISWVAMAVMAPIALYFSTLGTWDPTYQNVTGGWSGGFFLAQAEALVHGRFHVAPSDIVAECFDRDGRCYGYFGLTPSLLRVPVLGFSRMFESAFTPLFLTTAILLAYWASLRLVRRSLVTLESPAVPRGDRLTYAALVALALGPGSSLVFLSRPAVFEEALAWGTAFLLLTINQVWAWGRGETRRLWPAVLLGVAAVNARPTTAPACVLLGLVAFAWCWRGTGARATLVAALSLSLLPGLTAAGVFWAKLRTPLPSILMSRQVQEAPHWREILARNGQRTASLMFTPTALTAYFRPDSITAQSEWPFFNFRFKKDVAWVPPLPENGAYIDPVASLSTTMPLPWLLNLATMAWLVRLAVRSMTPRPVQRSSWMLGAGLFVSAAAATPLILTTVGITTRYLADFFALSAVGAALGAAALLPWFSRRRTACAAAAIVAGALVLWAILVTVSLNSRLVFELVWS